MEDADVLCDGLAMRHQGNTAAATIDRLAATSFVWLFSDVDQIIHLPGS